MEASRIFYLHAFAADTVYQKGLGSLGKGDETRLLVALTQREHRMKCEFNTILEMQVVDCVKRGMLGNGHSHPGHHYRGSIVDYSHSRRVIR